MKNKYSKRSKISEAKIREIVRYFAVDLTAMQAAELSGLNRNTINRLYGAFRARIQTASAQESAAHGIVEVDESYFGPRRVKGKRGRGAASKVPVFGLYERGGKVYTEIVPNCSRPVLQRIIRGHVPLDTVIHSDGWRGYNGLIEIGYGHFRVNHGEDEFARGPVHINGLEGFWGLCKVRLTKFKGLPAHTFHLHLKECEWRFNNRSSNLKKILLSYLRSNPIS